MPDDCGRAVDALHALDPGCPRDEWVRIAMAFKAAGGRVEEFIAWSSSAHNYGGEADCRAVWKSIAADGGIRAGTLFALARAAGWREERAVMSASVHRLPQQRMEPAVPQSALQAALAAWNAGVPAPLDHPYIARKKLLTDGLRVYRGPLSIKGYSVDGWLMMPGYVGGELRTLQFIGDAKLHFPGLKVEGFYTIGGRIEGDVYLGEGLGVAHTCHQATGRPAVASFGSGNTARAAEWIIGQGGKPIIVADRGKEHQAAEIARHLDCAWVEMPDTAPANYDVNDMHCAGGDLSAVRLYLHRAMRRHPRKYSLLSAADVLTLPAVRWRVKGLLPEVGVGVIGGQSGAGKSFVAIDLAMRLARGMDFFGHRVYRCPVVYLALEGAHGFSKRLRAWRIEHGELPQQVYFVLRQSFDIRNANDRAELLRSLADIGFTAGAIIIDTMAQAALGFEENSSEGMGEVIGGLQELQRATSSLVLAVHHLGKDASRGLRGHSSLFAACDVVLEVSRDGDTRGWKISKGKDGKDSETFGFELSVVQIGEDYDGDAITSCIVRAVDGPVSKPTKPLRGDRQVTALSVVSELLRNSSQFGKGGAPPTRPCIGLDEAIAAVGARLTCEDFRRNNEARRILMGLQRNNAIVVNGGWIWCP